LRETTGLSRIVMDELLTSVLGRIMLRVDGNEKEKE
jgi:hypothetical protein